MAGDFLCSALGEPCVFVGGPVTVMEFVPEGLVLAGGDGAAGALGEPSEVAEVVVGGESVAEEFVVAEEVVEVGEAELLAGEAVAGGVDGLVAFSVGGVADVEPAVVGEEGAVTAEPGGEDAIEHVDAAGDAFDEVFGAADAHEVAGPVDGELCEGGFGGGPHEFFGFSDG